MSRHDIWRPLVPDVELAQRLRAWQATVDEAIARIRAEEGFDGATRTWRTLGECLRPDPKQVHQQARRAQPVVACQRCGTLRFVGQQCATCSYRVSRRAHLQGLASQDVGRLAS